ncbi:MAG: SPASM domain-containing protein [Bacteroidales bacterium]|nr:SPASM domain-containing protein [Bacteroidales bacterium]
MNFGNVFENGVFNTINSKKAQAFRRMWQQNEAPEFCKYCNNINL